MNVCMTAEQKKNKEKAERFLLYLYQKYYPLIAEEIASREKIRLLRKKMRYLLNPTFFEP